MVCIYVYANGSLRTYVRREVQQHYYLQESVCNYAAEHAACNIARLLPQLYKDLLGVPSHRIAPLQTLPFSQTSSISDTTEQMAQTA